MKLLIDLGNTQLKYCLWSNGNLSEPKAILHSELAGHEIWQMLNWQEITHIYVSCVAKNKLAHTVKQLIRQYSQAPLDWPVSPANGLGIHNSYTKPEKWGVDRWFALAAAYHREKTACCVADIGTATTIDVCDAQGRHQGGVIAPGPIALSQALLKNTQLPRASTDWPATLGLASDTEAALLAGTLHSACGALQSSYTYANEHYACRKLILTGGGAKYLAAYLNMPVEIQSDLVFQGLILRAESSTNFA